MRNAAILVLGAALAAGCQPNPDQFGFSGFSATEFFVFDGSEREWQFVVEDDDTPHLLVGTLDTEFSNANGGDSKVYTISFVKDCIRDEGGCKDGDFVFAWSWSSDSTWGTQLHDFEVDSGITEFSPPLGVTNANMKVEDVVETDIDGTAWTSEFEVLEQCPVQWNVDWEECAKINMDDAGGSSPASGTIWAVKGWNIVAFELDGQPGRWELLKGEYTP